MKKIHIAILFGGKSAEHEVSWHSASNVVKALNPKRYEKTLVYIDKQGRWFLVSEKDFFRKMEIAWTGKQKITGVPAVMLPGENGILTIIGDKISKRKIDVVFPVLHGTCGEDGTVQGLLKLANVPFVGPGVLGSAVGMDKEVMKRLFKDEKIPIADYVAFYHNDKINYSDVTKKLGKILFVKPANLGSSVGISKVKDKEQFQEAVKKAFRFDNKIIVEESITCRELECSVLGNENPQAAAVGEVIPTREFYSYEAKYIDEEGAILKIPADLPIKIKRKIQELAVHSFKALNCEGMARVDFFLRKDGCVLVNEINTIPGFTNISMYPSLWKEAGMKYPELINELIRLAIVRFKRESKLETSYTTS
jgi:D-alanine-D-alanine ligase